MLCLDLFQTEWMDTVTPQTKSQRKPTIPDIQYLMSLRNQDLTKYNHSIVKLMCYDVLYNCLIVTF